MRTALARARRITAQCRPEPCLTKHDARPRWICLAQTRIHASQPFALSAFGFRPSNFFRSSAFGFPFPPRRSLDYDCADDDHKQRAVILNLIFGFLALLSLALTLWQWLVARHFPLHQRMAAPTSSSDPCSSRRKAAHTCPSQPSTFNPQPPLTLLKPLKGCDPATEGCLRSWLTQRYNGPVQTLFGVAAVDDPVCELARKLLLEFPAAEAQLVVGAPLPGLNAKVAKLAELEGLAKHELLVISDADVRVPPDFLANIVAPLCAGSRSQPMGGKVGRAEIGRAHV